MTKKNRSLWKIIVGGSGGQGIITFGKVLSCAGMNRKLNVSLLPSYGAEMRGGYVYCMLTFSHTELASPVISFADFGVFMNESSLHLLQDKLNNPSWCLWNSSLITRPPEKRFSNCGFPASELAETMGDIRAANMIMLGALGKIMQNNGFPVGRQDLFSGLKDVARNREQVSRNWKAVQEGWQLAERVLKQG